jgi:hypothetical protein
MLGPAQEGDMHEFERDGLKPAPPPVEKVDKDQSREPSGGSGSALSGPAMVDAASILHLQRTAGNAGVVQLLADEEERSPVHDVVGKGGGSPLDAATKSTMEGAFGDRFDDVRVHTGVQASRSAEAVGASAYTVGNDIVIRDGHLDQKTVAHELEHVRQQKAGPVDGSDAPGGIRLSDPSDRFERAATDTADQVVSSVQSQPAAASSSAAATAQRDADEDANGAAAVQRQMPEDEEEKDELSGE